MLQIDLTGIKASARALFSVSVNLSSISQGLGGAASTCADGCPPEFSALATSINKFAQIWSEEAKLEGEACDDLADLLQHYASTIEQVAVQGSQMFGSQ